MLPTHVGLQTDLNEWARVHAVGALNLPPVPGMPPFAEAPALWAFTSILSDGPVSVRGLLAVMARGVPSVTLI